MLIQNRRQKVTNSRQKGLALRLCGVGRGLDIEIKQKFN